MNARLLDLLRRPQGCTLREASEGDMNAKRALTAAVRRGDVTVKGDVYRCVATPRPGEPRIADEAREVLAPVLAAVQAEPGEWSVRMLAEDLDVTPDVARYAVRTLRDQGHTVILRQNAQMGRRA